MKRLRVLYDADCGLCRSAKGWLERQPQYVKLEFEPAVDPVELVVVDDRGRVYKGARAWVMVLWALKEYRGLARTLATPPLMGIARGFIAALSTNRHRISGLLGLSREK